QCGSARGLRLTARLAAPACDALTGTAKAKRHGRGAFAATRAGAAAPASGLPSSQALIAAALAAGRIDYPTSLLYRACVLFHDERRREELDGTGSAGDAAFFFLGVRRAWAPLDGGAHAALEPFLVRPDDPRSPLGPRAAASGVAGIPRAATSSGRCATRWDGRPTPAGYAKVWLCETAAPPADAARRT